MSLNPRTLFPLSAIAVAAALFISCSKPAKNPLSFQAPAGWKVEYLARGDAQSYALTANPPESDWLTFSHVPSLLRPEDISNSVQELAEDYRPHAQSVGVKVAGQGYKVEPFTGAQCQGSYAAFEADFGGPTRFQAVFMMSVNGKIWYGQFMGSRGGWTQALDTLKSTKLSD